MTEKEIQKLKVILVKTCDLYVPLSTLVTLIKWDTCVLPEAVTSRCNQFDVGTPAHLKLMHSVDNY